MRRFAAPLLLLSALALSPMNAHAFCGFYVAGADAKLVNNATQVVLMRDGTRTVLSMANNYQGPAEDFAMVVPVPIVLQKENVKTLPKEVFEHIEKLSSPRLVEYWEQDPCPPPRHHREMMEMPAPPAPVSNSDEAEESAPAKVKIEAKFSVGEYNIVILSAQDALALDTWLRQNNYKIPAGAEPVLRPYVQGGMKFFVAKVDPKKVRFQNGMAELSPLRFHYDSDLFALPVRLGLLNSSGKQDLIVHILSMGKRYEVANYDNVAIPTNIDIKDAIRGNFSGFYASLFDATLKRHPKAIITEYSWEASSCDPCPTGPLTVEDVATLGADAITNARGRNDDEEMSAPYPGAPAIGWVLTRLHARYSADSLGEDLVFTAAPAIVGGREHMISQGKLETTAKASGSNNFQARYAIRHPWTGPIKCEKPQRGIWGGPPGGRAAPPQAATGLAFAVRDVAVADIVDGDTVAAYELSPGGPVATTIPIGIPMRGRGCAGCAVGESSERTAAALGLAGLAVWLGASRRARRSRRA